MLLFCGCFKYDWSCCFIYKNIFKPLLLPLPVLCLFPNRKRFTNFLVLVVWSMRNESNVRPQMLSILFKSLCISQLLYKPLDVKFGGDVSKIQAILEKLSTKIQRYMGFFQSVSFCSKCWYLLRYGQNDLKKRILLKTLIYLDIWAK